MKCIKCGFENPEDSKFCSQCGNLLSSVCPKCGNKVGSNDSFCNECGYQLKRKENPITHSVDTKLPESTKRILGIVLLIAAIVLFFVGIGEEEWYQEDIIWYEIGSVLLSIGGIWLFKPEYLKDRKPLGVLSISYGFVVFLINIVCAGKSGYRSFAFYRIDFEEIVLTLFLFVILTILGIGLIKKSTEEKNVSETDNVINSGEKTEEDFSFVSEKLSSIAEQERDCDLNKSESTLNTEEKEKENITYLNDKVHYKTVIDGYGYWLAALISYVGLPIGLAIQLIQFFVIVSYAEAFMVLYYIFSIICQGIAMFGLKDFKRSAFVALMINYWTSVAVNGFVFIEAISMEADFSLISSPLVSLCVSIPFLVYFYHRKHSYTN